MVHFGVLQDVIAEVLVELAGERGAEWWGERYGVWVGKEGKDEGEKEEEEVKLPADKFVRHLTEEEIDVAIATSYVKRFKETLRLLPNIGISYCPSSSSSFSFPSSPASPTSTPTSTRNLIAWSFIGIDGSLATLFVQEA